MASSQEDRVSFRRLKRELKRMKAKVRRHLYLAESIPHEALKEGQPPSLVNGIAFNPTLKELSEWLPFERLFKQTCSQRDKDARNSAL